jgi:hypothetical protein
LTPVDQRVFAHTEKDVGDCLSACVATLLDLPLDEVPVFVAEPYWYGAMVRWLDARGFALILLQFPPGTWPWHPPDDLPLIVGGQSPRGPWGHAVIGIWRGEAMEVLHDPHPSRDGIIGDARSVYVLAPRAAFGAA